MATPDLHEEFVSSKFYASAFIEVTEAKTSDALLKQLVEHLENLQAGSGCLIAYANKLADNNQEFKGRDKRAEHKIHRILEKLCEQGINLRLVNVNLRKVLRGQNNLQFVKEYYQFLQTLSILVFSGLSPAFLSKRRRM